MIQAMNYAVIIAVSIINIVWQISAVADRFMTLLETSAISEKYNMKKDKVFVIGKMHIRITFSSNYYKYIYSSDIPKYYYIIRYNPLRNKIINIKIILFYFIKLI
jgi:hypothetical protein